MAQTISLDEARLRIRDSDVAVLPSESVDILASRGRYLATDHRAEAPWPTTDRSAMDGFALCAGSSGAAVSARFRVVGAALAGHPFEGRLEAGEAVRIMTGGVVPAGADTVAKVEDTSGFEGADVTIEAAVPPGANIRLLGSEIAVGDLLLRRGQRIRAAEIGALAVLGLDRAAVVRRPRVAILSTGDEVVEIGSEPALHQVRDSNSWALAAKVEELSGEAVRLGIVGDDAAALQGALERGLAEADILLTIGGVSKGTHDLVHGTLERLGVRPVFHGVTLKPGKPAFFGARVGDGQTPCRVFGLPGNPASCFTVFDLLVAPLMRRLVGAAELAAVIANVRGAAFRKNWRLQAVPATLRPEADASLSAELAPPRPSGDPFGLLDGCGYALIPENADPATTTRVAVAFYSSGIEGPQA